MDNLCCSYSMRLAIVLVALMAFSCNLDSFTDQQTNQQLEYLDEEQGEEDLANANMRLGNLIFEELFGTGSSFQGQSLQFAGSHSFQVVNDPLNGSNKVGKFELRYTDKIVKSGKRAEIGFRESLREGWYAYSVFFPTSGFSKDSYPEAISQWHQEGGGSPPNALQVENDQIYLRSINRSDTKDNSNKVYANYNLGNVERGKWTDFVFHIVHSPNSDGLIEIWKNGSKMHTIKGPNMRQGYPLPTLKVGIYKWTWSRQKTNTDRRIIYFDNVRIGNGEASLSDFISSRVPSVGSGATNGGVQSGSGSGIDLITGFNLIQANIDKDLGPISNGEVISSRTKKLSIRANTSPGFNGEVQFRLTGAGSHSYVDSDVPFALFGDNGRGDYFFGAGLSRGSYTLEATPYSGGEKAGKTVTIKFTVNN